MPDSKCHPRFQIVVIIYILSLPSYPIHLYHPSISLDPFISTNPHTHTHIHPHLSHHIKKGVSLLIIFDSNTTKVVIRTLGSFFKTLKFLTSQNQSDSFPLCSNYPPFLLQKKIFFKKNIFYKVYSNVKEVV